MITFRVWFQSVTSTSPAVIAWPRNFHPESIFTWVAMPTASPSGSTVVNSVVVWVISIARRYDRPGTAAIHGGPDVATLAITDSRITPQSVKPSPTAASHTAS